MLFTKPVLQNMLDSALAAIEQNVEMLNRLDSATGDGDHGTAILAAMKAAACAAKKDDPAAATLAAMLEAIGWEVMSSTSGSTSALTGSFFVGMASAATSDELNTVQTIELFEAGLAHVQLSTKAQKGDKTLMDALLPAIETLTAKKTANMTLPQLFEAAATAAKEGAENTRDMVAKHGRAKNLGQRSRGHLDAGAMSTALIYAAYANALLKSDCQSQTQGL